MSGSLVIAGLGPGAEELITPQVSGAIDKATDIIGYTPYTARIKPRPGLTIHASGNRVELDRSVHALKLAESGKHVIVVSSGDPGVFAMAAAVYEALETGPDAWKAIPLQVMPGITAMLAASARAGAPLGHDFCAINMSDNLKPFDLLEKRVRLAIEADFAIAFYNPRSKSRPHQFERILDVFRELCEPARLITFARAISTADENLRTVTMAEATAEMADMRTVVIVGSSQTKRIAGTEIVYTPRSAS